MWLCLICYKYWDKTKQNNSSLITNQRSVLWHLEYFHWIYLFRRGIASAAFAIQFLWSWRSNSPIAFQLDSSGCESPTRPRAALYRWPRNAGTTIVTWKLSRWRILYSALLSNHRQRIWSSQNYSVKKVYKEDDGLLQERSEATA